MRASDWQYGDILDISPVGGGQGPPQQAIGYQKEIKKTLGKTSETDAYLKFEMTSYVKCQIDL